MRRISARWVPKLFDLGISDKCGIPSAKQNFVQIPTILSFDLLPKIKVGYTNLTLIEKFHVYADVESFKDQSLEFFLLKMVGLHQGLENVQ